MIVHFNVGDIVQVAKRTLCTNTNKLPIFKLSYPYLATVESKVNFQSGKSGSVTLYRVKWKDTYHPLQERSNETSKKLYSAKFLKRSATTVPQDLIIQQILLANSRVVLDLLFNSIIV